MPIITECSEPGCKIKTMGSWCIDHDREAHQWPMLRDARPPESLPVTRATVAREPVVRVLSGAVRAKS